ncbi:hypothetical protein ACGFNU_45900 [Spirillospora sp. NPDC048911]|uniref:hypothetical protein n=1 Tax=Spirillospora sp. NPDC048911 TaxID=3364527 RepID=UPI003712D58F
MADDNERTQSPAETKVAGPTTTGRRRRVETVAMARRRAVNVVAWLISLVTTVVVLILAVHIVFVAFEANTANDLVNTVGDWADDLAWQFKDVFQPDDHKVEVAVNYGLAALVYLIVGRILTSLVRRLA